MLRICGMRRGRPSKACRLVEYVYRCGGEVMEEDILYEFGRGSDRRSVKSWLNKILRNGVKLYDGSRIYPLVSIRWRRRKIIFLPTNIPKPILKYIIYFTICSVFSFILGLTTWNMELLIYSTLTSSIIAVSVSITAYSGHYIIEKFKLEKMENKQNHNE